MVRLIATKLIKTLFFATVTTVSFAEPRPFTAYYDVYEDGKVKASLVTRLKHLEGNKYRLSDTTNGTAGLASLLNFKRTEITEFQYQNDQAVVLSHSMHQKVAFKTKRFEFNHSIGEKQYKGIDDEEPFLITSEQPLLSTHLLSWQLAQRVCQSPQMPMNWPVLKSAKAKSYHFRLIATENNRSLVHRNYDNRPDKSTAIWINHKDCYIEEIIYTKNNQVVRTVLNKIEFN